MVETKITSVGSVGQDTVAVELETPPEFYALPGQFVMVRVKISGTEETSYYTLSSKDVHDTFEITVAVEPDGTIGPWLADRDAGDTVVVEGPFGDIAYSGDSDVQVIASGPGIGPAIGIGERAIEHGHDASVLFRGEDPPHLDRLERLGAAGASVNVLEDAELIDRLSRMDTSESVFVFGFASFVDTVTTTLSESGIDPDDVEIENFGPQ
jgi:ferredoxin-NADP reductase